MAFAAVLAPILTVVGTAVSAYGTYQSMQQQGDMSEYNAQVAESQAKQTRLETSERVSRQRKENDRFKKRQRAAYAKSGITSTGTPLSVMSQTAADLELAALDTAYAGESKAQALMQQGAVNRYQSKSIRRAAPLAVGTTLLGGANQLARMKL